MTDTAVLEIALQAILIAAKLCAPILLVTLAVGFGISLLQAVTQIQEVTLTFVPKLVAVAVVVMVARPRALTVNRMPSSPTTMPAASTAARSGESSTSMGFELLMCAKTTVALSASARSRSRLPPAPPTGRCPICRARRSERPSRTSSSSLQKVPSITTSDAPASRASSASSIAPHPGR
ncbi:MAG: Flagellar biosynthesis protein FliQ [uncultured Gemmatimonadaceae bacterium]|uniref:Flagellar biosynthesis protein FliQ n=1 Tax=uncultured Gemmatimonadaceae bacterium TaxID=246130 RepID=A0A6J4MJ66_9BACT|nr:MAG: Flagellar biosynthesis protein FliQ [uncultured Gemmatimonadaceae bacterium]